MKVDVVAGILYLHQPPQQIVTIQRHSRLQGDHHSEIGLRRSQTVDTRHRSDDHHIAPGQQTAGGAVTQLVNFVVDRGILLDKGISNRDIGFRLVIVVIGNKVLHRVFGKEFLKLAVELGRQRLVGRQHQRGASHLRDDIGHGEGLAGAGHAQQYLMPQALAQIGHQTTDRFRLIAAGAKSRRQNKLRHGLSFRQKTKKATCPGEGCRNFTTSATCVSRLSPVENRAGRCPFRPARHESRPPGQNHGFCAPGAALR